MRGGVDGVRSAYPLGERLPSVFAEDELAQRFVAGLDDLFAPLLAVLDNMEAYFSPALAPADFVGWLAGWVGAELRGDEPEEQARDAVAKATGLHRLRGTRHGVAAAVLMAFGVAPEIVESGGATWSERPLGAFPGEAAPRLEVILRVPDPSRVDARRLDALVGAVRPAHVPYAVHVLEKGAAQ
ncbi:phage tail protein [Actinomadura syzygii]|uniref:Phage tail protein n=1 Tax=Actinomadura syzygii TaxID=1427538 RepID=A0A5D0UBJ4_9ACTN|nr:phage tail protein [Actinomadura syzygii]